ncbi:cation:proton antiporter [Xanthobacter autotrophicus DSM 431]|uniref:cation:proton antiporter domain-containing protein n=1 Tax=Xanthobacter nonsaccharivorans TaxID=3119912 RepID=UPI00372B98B5
MTDTVLKDGFVYLLAAGVLVPLFHRARIGAVVGFIVIGALLGPHGLGQLAERVPAIRFVTISSPERAAPFGELGVVFLLFLLGLEFSALRLWALRREVFGVGCLQVLLCGAVLALAATMATSYAAGLALVIGFSLALSSTAVVSQLLVDERRSLSSFGQLVIAVLLFQDLMVAPILLAAELLAGEGGNVALLALTALGKAAGAVVAILVAGRFVLAPLVAAAASTRSRELIMAITLVVVVGSSALTHAAGLSAALGAFLSGMMLSETAYRHQIEVDLEPFKGLLIGVFFVTVGMGVDFSSLLARLPLVLGATVLLIVLKTAFSFLAARLMGVGKPAAAEMAILLAQTGEFAFVVLGLLSGRGVLTAADAGALVAVVGLSLAATPLLARLGLAVGRRLDERDHGELAAAGGLAAEGHVVIGGFGRVGRMVAHVLEEEGVPFVAVDNDPRRVAQERAAGRPVYFGDAGRAEILERLGAEGARAFVVTLDAPSAAERMVAAVRLHWEGTVVIARAKDAEHARRLSALGVVGAIPEATEASLQLAAQLLGMLGLPEETVARRVALARERVRQEIERGRAEEGG